MRVGDLIRGGDEPVASSLDPETLRAVIVKVFPDLAAGTFTPQTRGWDSVAIDVDDRLIVKFPRHEPARDRLVRGGAFLAVIPPPGSPPTPQINLHEGAPPFSRHHQLPGAQ